MKTLLTIVIVLAGPLWQPALLAADDEVLTKPFMVDSANGWWQKFSHGQTQTLHTTDGGKRWADISPAALTEAERKLPEQERSEGLLSELSVLDARSACVAFASDAGKAVTTAHTADAGQHWQQESAPLSLGAGLSLSFVDAERGFLLTMGGKDLGMHTKRVYGTTDGGKKWHPLAEPPGNSFIPTGVAFRNAQEGWITGEYRGNDDRVLCHTVDGGKSWTTQAFKIPDEDKISYANTYPPVFVGAGKKQGYLPVKVVRNETSPRTVAWVTYETDDGGATWHLPASGVQYSQDD